MTSTKKALYNSRLRGLIDGYIRSCMPGTRVSAYDLVKQFTNRRRSLTTHKVCLLLRERPDLRHVETNVWVVVR